MSILEDDFKNANIGDELPDGWIIMGVSSETGEVFSAEPETMTLKGRQPWEAGQVHAGQLRDAGHANARQPDKQELNAMYNSKAVIPEGSKFNSKGSLPFGWHWSSSETDSGTAFAQVLGARYSGWLDKNSISTRSYVRCVRDEPQLTPLKAGGFVKR